jgi:transcriptional regulator with XRE-family HTH domain
MHASTVCGMVQGWPQYLDAAMKAAGFKKAAELASVTGINDSVISRWLSGKTTPTTEHLRRLSKPLRKPLLELMVAAGELEPAEAKMAGRPAPPEPPVGAGVDPALLADVERLDPAEVQRVRDFIKGIKSG